MLIKSYKATQIAYLNVYQCTKNTLSTLVLIFIQSIYVADCSSEDSIIITPTLVHNWLTTLRRPAPAGTSCIGVDLNRNWNVTGFGVGASTDPCSETYKVVESRGSLALPCLQFH